jgi:hypothetical protein
VKSRPAPLGVTSVGMAVKRVGERVAREKEWMRWLEKADEMWNVGM